MDASLAGNSNVSDDTSTQFTDSEIVPNALRNKVCFRTLITHDEDKPENDGVAFESTQRRDTSAKDETTMSVVGRQARLLKLNCFDAEMNSKLQETFKAQRFVTCPVNGCSKVFSSVCNLKQHFERCTGASHIESAEVIRCDQCGLQCNSLSGLKRHQTVKHRSRQHTLETDNHPDTSAGKFTVDARHLDVDKRLSSHPCKLTLQQEAAVSNGARNDSERQCDDYDLILAQSSGKQYNHQNEAATSRVGDSPGFKNLQFADGHQTSCFEMMAKLKEMLQVHGVVTCPVAGCNKVYSTLCGLQAHLKYCTGSGGELTEIACDVCGLRCNSVRLLKRHQTMKHFPQSFQGTCEGISSKNVSVDSGAAAESLLCTVNRRVEEKKVCKRGRPPKAAYCAVFGAGGVSDDYQSLWTERSDVSFSCVESITSNGGSRSIKSVGTFKRGRGRPRRVAFDKRALNAAAGAPVHVMPELMQQNPKFEVKVAPKPDEFEVLKCGVCHTEFLGKQKFKYHVLSVHNGLARQQGESQEFTASEKKQALMLAIKSLGKIKCMSDNCEKVFKTLGGFNYHENICGKMIEDRMVTCDLCGKVLLEGSLLSHQKNYHSKLPPRQEDDVVIMSGKKRKAAVSAKLKVSRIATAISDDAESCPKVSTAEESYDDEEVMGGVCDDDDGDNLFLEPEKQHISKEKFREWRLELERDGSVKCLNLGCSVALSSVRKMMTHYQMCPCASHESQFTCVKCSYTSASRKKMTQHVKLHKRGSLDALDMIEISNGACGTVRSPPKARVKNSHQTRDTELLYNRIQRGRFCGANSHLKSYVEFLCLNGYCSARQLFPNWMPKETDWRRLHLEVEYQQSLPKCKESPRFTYRCIDNTKEPVGDEGFRTLPLFGATKHGESNCAVTCFVGGPIWACDWCPTPPEISRCTQYLAVACHDDMNATHACGERRIGPGLIQIWDFGDLECLEMPSMPRLALGFVHRYGAVWVMAWCPSGCWDDPAAPGSERMKRLGLMAVAFADGCVRIYSMPHPKCLISTKSVNLFDATPAAVLHIQDLAGCESVSFQCTAVTWLKTRNHNLIAAGYTNGFVAIFDLLSESPLLRISQSTGPEYVCSVQMFQAHGGMVTGLDFAFTPKGTHCVSIGLDRCLKFWDLRDTTLPYNVLKKSYLSNVCWMPDWCGAFVAENNLSIHPSAVNYCECGYHGDVTSVTAHNSSILDLSPSYWLSGIVVGDCGGEVITSIVEHTAGSEDGYALKSWKLPICRFESVERFKYMKNGSDSKRAKKPISDKHTLKAKLTTYDDMVGYYDLVVKAEPVWDLKKIPLEELKRVTNCGSTLTSNVVEFPWTSVNRVTWNPNLGSHLWIACGGQSGMLHLVCLKDLKVLSVDSIRKSLLSSEIK